MEKFKELSIEEMQEVEGGFLPFIVIGACLLLASCGNSQTNNNNAGSTSTNINSSGTIATDSATVNNNSISVSVMPK